MAGERQTGPDAGREWIKPLVDTSWPYQIIETMNDLVDRAEAAEAERDAYKAALDTAARVLDEVVCYFDGGHRLPPAGFPLASVVRPARDAARSVLAGESSTTEE